MQNAFNPNAISFWVVLDLARRVKKFNKEIKEFHHVEKNAKNKKKR